MNTRSRLHKHSGYTDTLGHLFDATPKAVFAGVAMSVFINHLAEDDEDHSEHPEWAVERFCSEWVTLHKQGIIPQKPSREVREHAAKHRARQDAL